jgi:hypothetical protein
MFECKRLGYHIIVAITWNMHNLINNKNVLLVWSDCDVSYKRRGDKRNGLWIKMEALIPHSVLLERRLTTANVAAKFAVEMQ